MPDANRPTAALRERRIRQCVNDLIAVAAAVGSDNADMAALHRAEAALLAAIGLGPETEPPAGRG